MKKNYTKALILGIVTIIILMAWWLFSEYNSSSTGLDTDVEPYGEDPFVNIDGTGTTPANTNGTDPDVVVSPHDTEAKYLTTGQRKYIAENSVDIGDEAAFVIASTTVYEIWYSGIDDSFSIYFHNYEISVSDRKKADADIANILQVSVEKVCDYTIRVETPPTPFELDKAVTESCPR